MGRTQHTNDIVPKIKAEDRSDEPATAPAARRQDCPYYDRSSLVAK
jgi:hypothetical protein